MDFRTPRRPGPTQALPRLDPTDLEILHARTAFNLPLKATQDKLIDLFFKWVAPILPVINKTDFMARYRDSEHRPPMLLLQAIFSTTARISPKLAGLDDAKVYFKRAKALYDAGYEQDPVAIVQSLILMSWYYDGPQDGTENGLFYWSKLAIAVAQDHDMHRSDNLPELTLSEKRLWRRIWWTLFTRDRAVSAAYGRPVAIFREQTNVEMITKEDFLEEGGEDPSKIHVQFFLHYVKLCNVLELVAFRPIEKRNPRTVRSSDGRHRESEINQWLLNLPKELEWQQSRHEFWAAVLHYTYNTILCQFYGMLPFDSRSDIRASQTVVSEASSMIVSIVESIVVHNQLQFAPPSIVYSLVMVLIALKTQLSSTVPTLILQSQRKVKICLNLLGLASNRWPIAKMLREASEIVFNEKRFTELLEAATEHTHSGGQTEGWKPPYKRALLNEKRARPEFMLPKARHVVRMVLTNRMDEKTPSQDRNSPSSNNSACFPSDEMAVHTNIPISSSNAIPTYEEQALDWNPESLHDFRGMLDEVWDQDNFTLEEPMIPLFGMSSW